MAIVVRFKINVPALIINWFPGCAWEPISRGSASSKSGDKLEVQPPDLLYQAESGKE